MEFSNISKYSVEYLKLSNCIRVLASDTVEHAQSGHPGMVLGMADIMTVLTFNFLKFNPNDPKWFNRDRLILSAGHGATLLYTFYYLTNYKNFYLEDLKQFRKLHSKTPGHPEYGVFEAIETTTGPLGQGFANSVGMAIAQKKYQQKLGKRVSDHKIYCIVGDGCLMEGISYESASLAGNLYLNNLIILFDDNQISIDGSTNLTISENHLLKFEAMGWNTEAVDGHNFEQINASLTRAQNSDKPYFIAFRTLIAKGSINKVNSASAHGSPLGKEEIKLLKENLGFDNKEFFIPQELKDIWSFAWLRNQESYDAWQANFIDISEEQKSYLNQPNIDCSFLANIVPTKEDEATRVSSGRIIEELTKLSDKIIIGSADLSPSNNTKNSFSSVINKNDFSGNYIHYGIRENAMSAIMNGLAISDFLPIGGTFLAFSDYMKPSMRLSSVMNQQVIYVLTHDSIGLGEDGTTHQPIEHLASFRALPNMRVFRPADYTETAESWRMALSYTKGPSIIALTRQSVPQIVNIANTQDICAKGGYVLSQNANEEVDVAIFATGSELSIASKVQIILFEHGFTSKVISVLCFEMFFAQNLDYIENILSKSKLKVAIEAASSFGWHQIIGNDGIFFGIDQFGLSASSTDLYSYFGLTPSNITEKLLQKLNSL